MGKIASSLSKSHQKEEFFLQNGGLLLEDQFASCNGRSSPIRCYSVEDLINATNNFDKHHLIYSGIWYSMYKGSFKNRHILVKMTVEDPAAVREHAILQIHDIAVTAQFGKHKNILKLLGCCLELQTPALVYEYVEGHEILSDLLSNENENSFSWESRLKVARDIANAVAYLHYAYSSSIIHASLCPKSVIVDQYGVAKLLDFSMAISLQPGESQVEDPGVSCMGVCIDPEYHKTGIATTKIDVHSFGLILIALFTGKEYVGGSAELLFYITDQGKKYIDVDNMNETVDSRILEEGRGGKAEREEQLQAFLKLALRCVQCKGENRPEMIEVAKELRRIGMAVRLNCDMESSSCPT